MTAGIKWTRQATTANAAPQAAQDLAAGHHNAAIISAARQAFGTFTYTANLSAGDLVTINNTTLTAVASGATSLQFNIGGSLSATLTAIVAAITALSAVSALVTATATSTVLTITAKAKDGTGNAIYISKRTGDANCVVSGSQLTGGVSGDVQSLQDAAETVGIMSPAGNTNVVGLVLNDGEEGQSKTIYFYAKNGGNIALTCASGASFISGGTVYSTATFSATTNYVLFKWMGGFWVALVNSGVTFS